MAETSDNPDIEFSYDDSDSYENEIAELYSYSEEAEFQLNIKAFEGICGDAGVLALWQSMTPEKKFSLVTRITDQMDHCNSELRTAASRALLYIIQGCWGEAQSDQEQISWVRHNCFLLLDCNSWSSCMQLLNIEIECWVSTDAVSSNSSNNKQQSQQYSHVSSASSTQLRIILSILCTMVETLRRHSNDDNEKQSAAREAFCAELAMPQEVTDELLAVTLLSMVTRFCNSSPPHFPIRKLLLLLWKVLLVTLGGSENLRETKHNYRTEAGLASSLSEDTVTVCRPLRPVSPPALASDLIEQTQHNMIRRRPFRRSLMKQSSLDDSMSELELNAEDEQNNPSKGSLNSNTNNGSEDGDSTGSDNSDSGISEDSDGEDKGTERPGSPPSTNPSAAISPMPPVINSKGLPWAPKVRQKDIDCFLEMSRDKFVGYQLLGDSTTLTGLPPPIHEGVHILSKHIYTSLSEVQMKREEEIFRNPLSRPEGPVLETNSEILYQCLLPTLPQSMIALLKVLLAAAPTSKAKTDSINIMSDVLPEEMPLTVVQNMKLGLDVNRHKEVLVKAVSASLLLLLKHFKLNHIYQFEFMSQHLVFANCIPLILKFFNQNIMGYVQAKNTIALLDFPSCVIGDGADLSNDALMASIGAASAGLQQQNADNKSMDGSSGDPNLTVLDSASTAPAAGTSNGVTSNAGATNGGNNNNDNSISSNTTGVCCWRNMFSCVNLLRILNKLCKWKSSRIMMLVVFKSAPILKRTLMVKHALLQLYVLKLLKMQTKYLGRQWRKSNMKTLSAIYQLVRHRLNDDWAYGNDPDARPWDFQTEECSLRTAVDRFNTRRYHQQNMDSYMEPVDNCITSVLGRDVELTDDFRRSYELWLHREVLNTTIHWDLLLSTERGEASAESQRGCTNCSTKWCECLVTVCSSEGHYTPLIEQLKGYPDPSDDGDDQDGKFRTVHHFPKKNNGVAAAAANGTKVVDIDIDGDCKD